MKLFSQNIKRNKILGLNMEAASLHFIEDRKELRKMKTLKVNGVQKDWILIVAEMCR